MHRAEWNFIPLVLPDEGCHTGAAKMCMIRYANATVHAMLSPPGHSVHREACRYINIYHASDKIVGILLDRSRSHDSVKITVFGVEIRIWRLIEFEAAGEQSKMADDELVAMDLSWGVSFCTDF